MRFFMKSFFIRLKFLELSKHPNNTLASNLKSKKFDDWPKILLAIIVIFESLQSNIKCLFLPIAKIVATIHILSPQSITKIVFYTKR